MRPVAAVFAIGWAAFWLYWFIAAIGARRGARVAWSRELRIRGVIIVIVVVLVRLHAFRGHGAHSDVWLVTIGLVLFVAGLAFAIWARLHIGRYWGTPMTTRQDTELVTSGPYRFVRHPIYSGILAAGIGTALAVSWHWWIAVLLAGVYFIYAAIVEERNLMEQFPERYPVYKRSSKMLVPFVF